MWLLFVLLFVIYGMVLPLQAEQTSATIRADHFIRLSGAFGKRRLELGKLDEELTMPLVGHPTSTVMFFGRVFLGAALCLASPLLLESLFTFVTYRLLNSSCVNSYRLCLMRLRLT